MEKLQAPLTFGSAIHMYFQGFNKVKHKLYTTDIISNRIFIQKEDKDRDKEQFGDVFRIFPASEYYALQKILENNTVYDSRNEYKYNDLF